MNNAAKQPPAPSSTRREFLRTGSAVVAAGALASQLDIARAAHVAGDDTIRLALIGCGGRGTQATMQALSTPGSVKLVAMADVFEDRLKSSLDQLTAAHADVVDVPPERQFVGFDAYKNAIDAGVDMVVHATPPGFRPLHLQAAIEAGKHVFTEKPVAVDAPGIRTVLAAAKEAKKKGLCIGVGLQRHHQAHYLETIRRLQEGAIGDILYTRVYWNSGNLWVKQRADLEKAAGRKLPELEYQLRNWYYFNWICGDHIVEQHIHNIDVGVWLKGDHPVKAQGMGGRERRRGKDHGQIFDHHTVEFTYDDGTQMFSQCRHMPNCWTSVSEHAVGTSGTANISEGTILGDVPWRYRGRDAGAYQQEHNDLFAAIRAGTPYNEAEFAAISTMTAIMGRMATYSGQLITWDEAIASELSLADTASLTGFESTAPVLPDDNGYYPVPVPGVTQVL